MGNPALLITTALGIFILISLSKREKITMNDIKRPHTIHPTNHFQLYMNNDMQNEINRRDFINNFNLKIPPRKPNPPFGPIGTLPVNHNRPYNPFFDGKLMPNHFLPFDLK